MQELTLSAPAKINYLLDVISKRPDGYHNLRMIMQRISLSDSITVTISRTPGITVTCNSPGAPNGPDNIAWKAARALLDYAHCDTGVTIRIHKKIPVAAGLGGGSSNAATVLMGLNKLLKLGITDQKLMEIGCKLGADVPFFIYQQATIAEGIGEVFTPLPDMPHCHIVLVNPGVHVSTAWVYRSLQLTNHKELATIPKFFTTAEQITAIMSNDLEAVTIPAYPVIAEIKQLLVNLGAIGSMMSGSGSTVFGVFTSRESAEAASIELARHKEWLTVVTETI